MSTKVASLYAEIGADTTGLQRGLKGAKSGLQDFKTQTEKAASPVRNFNAALSNIGVVAGVATAALYAIKRGMDLAREGAELEFAAQKFDRLSESIGTMSDALLLDLRSATRGLVSDAELISSAGDFMSLGLAKTHDQVVRLTKVAGALGMNMNQLVLTLTNQTTMRFDALGVAVDGFDARMQELKKTGLSTSDAFTEAFLQQAEAQIERVGEVADTSVGAFKRLEASSKDLKDEWLKQLIPAGEKLASSLADIAEVETAKLRTGELLAEAESRGILVGQDLYDLRLKILDGDLQYKDAVILLTETIIKFNQEIDASAEKERNFATQTTLGTEAVDLLNASMRDDAEVSRLMAGGIAQAGEAAQKAAPPIKTLNDILATDPGSPLKSFIQDLQFTIGGGGKITAAFDSIKKALVEGKITPQEAEAFSKELAIATEDLKVELNQTSLDDASKSLADTLGIPIEDAKKMITGTDGLQAALLRVAQAQYDLNFRFVYSGTPPPGWPGGGSPGGIQAPPTPGNDRWQDDSSGKTSVGFGASAVAGDLNVFIDGAQSPEATASAVVAAIQSTIYANSRAGGVYAGV